MTEQFDIYERLYRAVYPPEIMPMFWKENGEISSAVFRIKEVCLLNEQVIALDVMPYSSICQQEGVNIILKYMAEKIGFFYHNHNVSI